MSSIAADLAEALKIDLDGESWPVTLTTFREYLFPLERTSLGNTKRLSLFHFEQVSEREVRLTWEGRGVRVVRSLSAGEGPYQIWSTTRIENTADYARTTRLEMATYHYVRREDESGAISFMPSRSSAISQGTCIFDDDSERKDRSDLVDDDTHLGVPHGYGNGDVHIAAVENLYFTPAMAPHGVRAPRCAISVFALPGGTSLCARAKPYTLKIPTNSRLTVFKTSPSAPASRRASPGRMKRWDIPCIGSNPRAKRDRVSPGASDRRAASAVRSNAKPPGRTRPIRARPGASRSRSVICRPGIVERRRP